MTPQNPQPIDPPDARPGDLLRWSYGTTHVIVAPGLVSDGHGGTIPIYDAIARWPYGYMGIFAATPSDPTD